MPIASQQEAALVARMAERAIEDEQWMWVMCCAGCTESEIRAAMKGRSNCMHECPDCVEWHVIVIAKTLKQTL